ncbi:MAG: hypothetical protein ACHQYP_09400 [Nitrospiria bacterium]
MLNKKSKTKNAKLPRRFKMPWGEGQIIEEVSILSEYHIPTIQLMQFDDGSYTIRFVSYSHKGMFQRSPLMVNAKDLKRLGAKIQKMPKLKKLISGLVK